MWNLECFWQSSILRKIPNALFPPNPSIYHQFLVWLYSLCQPRQRGGGLVNSFVQLHVNSNGIQDCWTQIRKIMDNLQFIIRGCDAEWHVHILSHDLHLLPEGWWIAQTPNTSCWLKQFMDCKRSSADWAVTAVSSAKGKSCRHFSWPLDFALSLEKLKSFPSVPGSPEVEAYRGRLRGMFQHQRKEGTKQGGS